MCFPSYMPGDQLWREIGCSNGTILVKMSPRVVDALNIMGLPEPVSRIIARDVVGCAGGCIY